MKLSSELYLYSIFSQCINTFSIFLPEVENGGVNMDNMQSEKENENGVDKSPYVNGDTDSKGNLFSHKFLFGVIFSRCRDLSATVRAKVCVYDVYMS